LPGYNLFVIKTGRSIFLSEKVSHVKLRLWQRCLVNRYFSPHFLRRQKILPIQPDQHIALL
jgi:hypothetical protein